MVLLKWFGQESKDLAEIPLLWLLRYKGCNNGSSAFWLVILKFLYPTLLVHVILALDFLASLTKTDFYNYGKLTITRMSPGWMPRHFSSSRHWRGFSCRVLLDQALALPRLTSGPKDPLGLAPCWGVLLNSFGLSLSGLTIVKNQVRVLKWVSESYRNCSKEIWGYKWGRQREKINSITFKAYGAFQSHLIKFSL